MLNVLKADDSDPQVVDNWNPTETIDALDDPSSNNAYSIIEAEDYTDQSGISTQASSEGTDNVGWIDDGDWIMFENIDFGSYGASTFEARVARYAGIIEIRLDGISGTLIGTLNVTATGGSQVYETQSTTVSGAVGTHDLYLVFGGGGGFNINWFTFTKTAIANGSYSIIAKHSGKGLDVSGWNMDNGANIHQYTYAGQANQQWNITSVGDGYYKIENVHSGRALDIEGASMSSGANLQQWGYGSGGENKQFRFEDKGDGYYWIIARHSGQCLDVESASTNDGANVQQWGCTDSDHQKWQLNHLGSLRSAHIQIKIDSKESSEGIKLYPNPANDIVTITSETNISGQVIVTNLSGEMVAAITPNGNKAYVKVRALSPGIYIVTVENKTLKLIVK
jgi:hypothetical protein